MKKVLLKSMLLFVAILFAGIAQAQTVTGTVTEGSGPLPGANVIVKGTSNGTTTDFDGGYTLNNVASDATLVFSYVGYTTKEIAVGGQTTINTTLAADNTLDEVVLIGYGSTTIKDATGTVSLVTEKEFNQGVIQSAEQLIQGKTAGVQISEGSGQPGSGITVNIRGSNSIRSGNGPLYVVDGIPLAGGGSPEVNSGGIGSASGGNPLTFLNPNDIESISILKDASSTAIYGSRAANGVIIIKTKGGRGSSKGVWELNSSVSVSTVADTYDLLDRDGFLETLDGLGLNQQGELDEGFDTDWQDFYIRTAYSRQTDLSYSKSYKSGNVRASFGYGNNLGLVEDTDLERIAGRVNITQKFFDDKLTLTGNGSISRVNRQQVPLDGTAGSTGDLIGAALTQNPTSPSDPNATFTGGNLNPANLLENYLGQSNSERILANLSANYQITDELSTKVSVGYDKSFGETVSIFGGDVIAIPNTSDIGRGNYAKTNQRNILLDFTVNYKKTFGNIELDILGGYSYQEFDRNGAFVNAAGFGSSNLGRVASDLENQLGILNNAIDGGFLEAGFGVDGNFVSTINNNSIQTGLTIPGSFDQLFPAFVASTFDNADELQSFFARANVTFNEKFLFTGTFRADGSTAFGENNQYGYFPSGAFAWRLDQEDFVGDNISTLKLRLAAGIVGSQEGLDFGLFLPREETIEGSIPNALTVLDNGIAPGTQFVGNANPDLQWEETTDFNIGIDYGFNNDRLSGSFNLYRKETRDLLFETPLAAPATAGTRFENIDAVVVNQGVEFQIGYDFINTDDWSFSSNFNIAYNDNEVQDLQGDIPFSPIRGQGLTNDFAQQLSEGQPINSFFLARFTGLDEDGFATYFDADGNGTGEASGDRVFSGKDANPDVLAGLSFNLRYKNFDISTYLNGQFGFYVFNATEAAFFNRGSIITGSNITTQAANGNDNPSQSIEVSDRFLEKGDFVRLTNATFGYNFPVSGDGLFDSLRFTFTGQNLFLITGYDGLDPELQNDTGSLGTGTDIPSVGIDYSAYPRGRTFTLGVNARF